MILPAHRREDPARAGQPEAPYLQRETMQARIALLTDIEVIRMAGTHHLHLEDPHAGGSGYQSLSRRRAETGQGACTSRLSSALRAWPFTRSQSR